MVIVALVCGIQISLLSASLIQRLVVPMDQTTIKTLYVFVEIGIDSSHLAHTVRMNFPSDRQTFHEMLLDDEEASQNVPIGTQIGPTKHLRIEGPGPSVGMKDSVDKSTSAESLRPSDPTRLALVSTIQFVSALQRLKEDITVDYIDSNPTHSPAGLITDASTSQLKECENTSVPRLWTGKYEATIPRSKPLSPGEILGCTAPRLGDVDALVYAFHYFQ